MLNYMVSLHSKGSQLVVASAEKPCQKRIIPEYETYSKNFAPLRFYGGDFYFVGTVETGAYQRRFRLQRDVLHP